MNLLLLINISRRRYFHIWYPSNRIRLLLPLIVVYNLILWALFILKFVVMYVYRTFKCLSINCQAAVTMMTTTSFLLDSRNRAWHRYVYMYASSITSQRFYSGVVVNKLLYWMFSIRNIHFSFYRQVVTPNTLLCTLVNITASIWYWISCYYHCGILSGPDLWHSHNVTEHTFWNSFSFLLCWSP